MEIINRESTVVMMASNAKKLMLHEINQCYVSQSNFDVTRSTEAYAAPTPPKSSQSR